MPRDVLFVFDKLVMAGLFHRGRARAARFDGGQVERLLEQWIVEEINLTDREVVRRAPIGVNLAEQFRSESICFHDLTFISGMVFTTDCVRECLADGFFCVLPEAS